MAIIVIVFAIVLARTRFGRYVFAIGGNEEAARLAGDQRRLGQDDRLRDLGRLRRPRRDFADGALLVGIAADGRSAANCTSIAAVVVGGTS